MNFYVKLTRGVGGGGGEKKRQVKWGFNLGKMEDATFVGRNTKYGTAIVSAPKRLEMMRNDFHSLHQVGKRQARVSKGVNPVRWRDELLLAILSCSLRFGSFPSLHATE